LGRRRHRKKITQRRGEHRGNAEKEIKRRDTEFTEKRKKSKGKKERKEQTKQAS
jgi:hypothetical protein